MLRVLCHSLRNSLFQIEEKREYFGDGKFFLLLRVCLRKMVGECICFCEFVAKVNVRKRQETHRKPPSDYNISQRNLRQQRTAFIKRKEEKVNNTEMERAKTYQSSYDYSSHHYPQNNNTRRFKCDAARDKKEVGMPLLAELLIVCTAVYAIFRLFQ